MKDAFIVLPDLQHILDSTRWDVTNTSIYQSGRFGLCVAVTPPFSTDLASVPRAAWLLIPRDDKNIVEPAVFHDWLYAHAGRLALTGTQKLTRMQCDRLLSDAMKLAGAPWWKRHAVYLAVRLGGWKPWAAYASKQP